MNVEKTYDRYASVYDTLFGFILHDGRKKLAKLINKEKGEKILEIGVGSGLMLALYEESRSITGIDISQRMLIKAAEKIKKLPNRDITLIYIDGEKNSLPPESYDHVVLPYVYSVSPEPDLLISECFRLCRPGGSIWILNHFSGLENVWDIVGIAVKKYSNFVGFRSDFPYHKYVTSKNWQIEHVSKANLLGLSRIIQIKKSFKK